VQLKPSAPESDRRSFVANLEADLLEILACPDTHHAPLDYDPAAQTLTCTECGRVFPVRDGIPVLLLDEATMPERG